MSRRFLNMVSQEFGNRLYTLCRIDLNKNIFYESTEAAAARQVAKAKKTRGGWPSTISSCKRLPRPDISFSGPPCQASNSNFHFFSLLPGQGEGCVMATDPHGNAAIYDAYMGSVLFLPPPNFRKPSNSIALSVAPRRRATTRPGVNREDDHALYFINKSDGTFELFKYCRTGVWDHPAVDNNWYWCPLTRLPPWLGDSGANVVNHPFAAAVVHSTSTIYVSSKDGTYAYNLSTGIWGQAGSWVLPCIGAAEHVPELGLWFGVQGDSENRMCAFDLPSRAMADSGPASKHAWDYLDNLPDEWLPVERHLLNLGSGKFCIVTYCIYRPSPSSDEELSVLTEITTVLTGVEVVHSGDGLQMIKHKSQRYDIENTRIHCVL